MTRRTPRCTAALASSRVTTPFGQKDFGRIAVRIDDRRRQFGPRPCLVRSRAS